MAENATDSATGGVLSWFPSPASLDVSAWRLDVVTLLAVIGESSMAEHSQTITASFLCLFPRILPAPQALLKPSRPPRLPETPAKTAGVFSGVVLDTVGFFANIIQPLDELPAFAFKALEIRHRIQPKPGSQLASAKAFFHPPHLGRGAAKKKKDDEEDVLQSPTAATATATGNGDVSVAFSPGSKPGGGGEPSMGILRQRTVRDKVTDFVTNPTRDATKRPAVPVRLDSPMHYLAVFSTLLTVGLLVMAVKWKDGAAILAVSMISTASSVVGYASWWEPILMNLSHENKVPPGDIVIRTREGAFVYVKCKEAVARELFLGTEECKYRVGDRMYRLLMGIGTVFLMVSVVLLGNCSWFMQLFVGSTYVSLNGLYWALGMMPRRLFWDLSRYDWVDITPEDAQEAEKHTKTGGGGAEPSREDMASFTRTLWYAIRETKRTAWVERSGAAPGTAQWKEWLKEAEQAAKAGRRDWPAVARKDEIMLLDPADPTPWTTSPHKTDSAEQHAPLSEVQGRKTSVAGVNAL